MVHAHGARGVRMGREHAEEHVAEHVSRISALERENNALKQLCEKYETAIASKDNIISNITAALANEVCHAAK